MFTQCSKLSLIALTKRIKCLRVSYCPIHIFGFYYTVPFIEVCVSLVILSLDSFVLYSLTYIECKLDRIMPVNKKTIEDVLYVYPMTIIKSIKLADRKSVV